MGKITINQDALKSRREWKRHEIQKGSNVFRILPPFGDVEVHNNYPYRKWSTAWLVDPKTGKRRPFATPLTDGEQECPIREYSDKLNKFIDKLKSQLEAKGLSEDKVKDRLKGLREVAWQIKVQHSYVYNATDKSGEVGILELKSTAHQGVKKMMNQYIKDYGQDPTTLESDITDNAGVWFLITKEGEGKMTEYKVEFNQLKEKQPNGKISKEDDRSPLSDNIVENYDSLGYDLNAVYTRKSYDELREILLYNLALLSKETPECVLPGYDISDMGVESAATAKQEVVEEEEVKLPPKKTAPKVNLQLDDEDDVPFELDTPKKAPAKTAPPTTKRTRSEIEAMADAILGE
jgi:hypothetical protein